MLGPVHPALEGFHPTIVAWFAERFGAPSPPQALGWPAIRRGEHVLVAAPTGMGKTLAAFLAALDRLLRAGAGLTDRTRVLYVSPLKALGNDVQKNLAEPLAALRARDPALADVRVVVRTGDTPAVERERMARRNPHVLVTTPESLYILLTTRRGREMLAGVETVIVDEIHALVRDKRGSHLALSLERLEALAGPFQRIGLSATQRPIEEVARFLGGLAPTGAPPGAEDLAGSPAEAEPLAPRPVTIVDVGHRRDLDLAVVVPDQPLEAVCSLDTWEELHDRITGLIQEHRTTLVFVNTRALAERLAASLAKRLGADDVASHHGSLSRELRLDAEQRLKAGKLRALVATASLELGIDIGDVDLVVQVGGLKAISTLLQRVGRAGHALGKTPKGRLFPLTRDELVEAAAALRAVRQGELDRLALPEAPLDILAQHVVAACVAEDWDQDALLALVRRAWPYRALERAAFDRACALHTHAGIAVLARVGEAVADGTQAPVARGARGRAALLHHDPITGRLRATKRARLVAVQCGGAIPDTADFQVRLEPEDTFVGTLNEDFAIESSPGDVFQLGCASWQIVRVESGGVVRVVAAPGAPPTIPFWLGEAPARTAELARAVSAVRAEATGPGWLEAECGLDRAAAAQLWDYLEAGRRALGCVPTQGCVVAERFFDEGGGQQLVLHTPFGGRVNRALGLALRKRFCRGFGFELQAAANEEAILLSLGPQHSFPLDEVFDFLKPATVERVLVQALIAAPMFQARWRWNVTRSLLVERSRNGKKVPPQLVRMRSDDLMAAAFPQAAACPETLPGGDVEVPFEHPVVGQTVADCLSEAMDLPGLVALLEGLGQGRVARRAVDTPEPSAFAQGILTAQPYTFLDDAPLEERRARAVQTRRGLGAEAQDGVGALDPEAIARVRAEAWPDPASAEEVHEALSWMGWVGEDEAPGWLPWLRALEAQGRAERVAGAGGAERPPEGAERAARWFACGASRDPVDLLRGRLEALGPIVAAPEDEPALRVLEQEGVVLRVRFDGRDGWCDRRLLARIQRATVDRLRREIEPVSAADLWRFLAVWQHVAPETRLEGPAGLEQVLRQLAGFEVPAAEWERSVLPARVQGYRRDWLDQLGLSGRFVWLRLWPGPGERTVAVAPLALVPREELAGWLGLARAARGAPAGSAGAWDPRDFGAPTQRTAGRQAGRVAGPPGGPRGNGRAPADVEPGVIGGEVEAGEGAGAIVGPAPAPAPADALVGLLRQRGAMFQDDLARGLRLGPDALAEALGLAVARGLVTCDAFGAVRALVVPPSRRAAPVTSWGRWSVIDGACADGPDGQGDPGPAPLDVEAVAWTLLRRWGVVFKRLLARERIPAPWRELLRCLRRLELRGQVRGGRFVAGFPGEQFALPEAVERLRAVRRARRSQDEQRGRPADVGASADGPRGAPACAPPGALADEAPRAEPLAVSAADPLNLLGILTSDERVPRTARRRIEIGGGP